MRDCSAHPEPHPSLARGASLRLSKFVPDKFVEPAIRITVYTLSRRAPSTTRTPLHLQQTTTRTAGCGIVRLILSLTPR